MKHILLYLVAAGLLALKVDAQKTGADAGPESILEVRRVYVAQLTGGVPADALRELLIASLDSSKLFVLTDNIERADAVLKGAADDRTFEDTFDSSESVNGRTGAGTYGSGSGSTRTGGTYGALTGGGSEYHRIKERKHEAYAAVRLCNKQGDVLWSTTQESLGAKFKGASADVAAKVAHQLSLDMERARRTSEPPSPVVPKPSASR